MIQVVEYMLSKCKALSRNPSNAEKNPFFGMNAGMGSA
jgi:hypothetical protein